MQPTDPHPTTQTTGSHPRPAAKVRIVAPDIARGLALWGIAAANMGGWAAVQEDVPGAEYGGVLGGGLFDQLTVVALTMFADIRGLPMFTLLLGFGVGLITLSLARRGYPRREARKTLARRYIWLAVFGAIHAVLLFYGDIMFTYGMIVLVLVLMIGLRDRTLLIIAGVLWGLMVTVILAAVIFFPGDQLSFSIAEQLPVFETYWLYLLFNLNFQLFNTMSLPVMIFVLLPLMILGFVAARQGVHLTVARYRRLLWAWVTVAVLVMVTIGLPLGLASLGVLPTEWAGPLTLINQGFGVLTGPGIAAGVLLACEPLDRRRREAGAAGRTLPRLPLPLAMVAALGERSMSGYLAQSIFFVLICFPFTLHIGPDLGAFGQFIIAFVVWLLTLILAWIMSLRGWPGPFEKLHRRLSYGADGLAEQWQPQRDAGKKPTRSTGSSSIAESGS